MTWTPPAARPTPRAVRHHPPPAAATTSPDTATTAAIAWSDRAAGVATRRDPATSSNQHAIAAAVVLTKARPRTSSEQIPGSGEIAVGALHYPLQ
jgi:hypothetical protein